MNVLQEVLFKIKRNANTVNKVNKLVTVFASAAYSFDKSQNRDKATRPNLRFAAT
jgi:hypothetical protein